MSPVCDISPALLSLPRHRLPITRSGTGPVAQPVFKIGPVVQPTACSVRLRGRSAKLSRLPPAGAAPRKPIEVVVGGLQTGRIRADEWRMSTDDRLAELQAEEQSLSRQRARLQDRIDFIRAGGSGSASATQVEEQLRLMLEKERALSARRAELHAEIGARRPRRPPA